MGKHRFVRVTAFFVCLILLLGNIGVFAYKLPAAFWAPGEKYTQALNSNDYQNIIKYGKEIIEVMKNEPDNATTREVVGSKYKEIAGAYAILGDPESAYTYYLLLQEMTEKYPEEFHSWNELADAAVNAYPSEIALYTDKGSSVYFGAKNEKKNGVLFGTNADGQLRLSGQTENESMTLAYQELGQELLAYNKGIMMNASKGGYAVEFALNCPNEGADIRNIKKLAWSLEEVSDLLKSYSDVPVYLRFAAEFDVWDDVVDAESFKSAFRYVSRYFKDRNSNVAIVWSPNQASSHDIDDYYPGDEYVDWVGLSSYAVKYYLADKNQSEANSLLFKAGDNSHPVVAVREIVEKYGDRKPIMISESGSSHYVYNGLNEDLTDFALQRLREYYSYLPMVYPQIKLIAHFDYYISGAAYDFRLSNNKTLSKEYLKLTKGERFIQDSYDNDTDFSYRKITSGTVVDSIFPVSCYAYLNGDDIESVVYYIDNKYVAMSNELPFSTFIDASDYSGNHVLKAIAISKSGKRLVTESSINIQNYHRNITVEISDEKVSFDQEPILYNGRTLVPMRKIFEELGATVSWNDETKTATGRRGDREVKVTVGSKKMYVNGKEIALDTSPIVLSGRTLVPARAVAEGMGCDVDWDDKNSLVQITPKVFKWSDWDTDLPDYVNEEMYYIEEQTEYRYRTREEEYFTLDYKLNISQYVRTDVSYGEWSQWQDTQIVAMSDGSEVETRTVSTPMKYHYAHYCTGWLEDSSKRYRTRSYNWCDECTYHELGWFDSPLSLSPDSDSDYVHYVNGEKYKCTNTCYRWYLIETTGGTKTQYRSRDVYKTYVYWEWSDWSRWSDWDTDDPYDWFDRYDNTVDVDERTVYRYKEK